MGHKEIKARTSTFLLSLMIILAYVLLNTQLNIHVSLPTPYRWGGGGVQMYSSTYSQTQQQTEVIINFIVCMHYPSERDHWREVQAGPRASLDILEKVSPLPASCLLEMIKNVRIQILFNFAVMCYLFSSCVK
jgi:hypothetical protein